MRYIRKIGTALLLIVCPALCFASEPPLMITAVNDLTFGRLNQFIELSTDQLTPLWKVDLNTIHIKDAAGRMYNPQFNFMQQI